MGDKERVMPNDSFAWVKRGCDTLGGGDMLERRYPLMDEDEGVEVP